MGKSRELFEKYREEDILGEEHRAYVHWIEQEQYERYPNKPKEDDNNV